MKMKKITIALMGLAAAAAALPAAAQMRAPALNSFYVGATVGRSDAGNCEAPAGISCDTKDTAWRILGGYQFHRNFAAELGYHNLGDVKFSATGVSAKVATSAWELVGVGMLPFANQFSAYGKLGAYRAKSELTGDLGSGSDTSTGLTWGIGAQWDVMPQLGLRLEWQQYNDVGGDNSAKGDINVLGVGAIWRFK